MKVEIFESKPKKNIITYGIGIRSCDSASHCKNYSSKEFNSLALGLLPFSRSSIFGC